MIPSIEKFAAHSVGTSNISASNVVAGVELAAKAANLVMSPALNAAPAMNLK